MTDKEMLRLANGLCDMKQGEGEILWALERIRNFFATPISSFLEIGCYEGGSLCMWSQILLEDGVLYGVSLHNDPDELQNRVSCITGKEFIYINGRSELQETKDQLLDLLDGDLLDGIFIDSHHTEIQVKQEMNLYFDLVKSPGIVIFHDIMQSTPEMEVSAATIGGWWQKNKYRWNYEEKRDVSKQWFGTGMIFK